jgi:hypothetical protein
MPERYVGGGGQGMPIDPMSRHHVSRATFH